MDYKRKIDFAIKLLRSIPQDGPIEVSYSGGKDSDVILELAKMAGIPYEAIYKNTTIDPPGTIAHAREMGATIINPKQSFYEILCERGWPNRWRRFCCAILKEYKVHDRAIQGIRRSESVKRAERYKEPEMCRTYPHKEKARIYLPILEWDLEDVARFIDERGIKCAPVYYDECGTFHPERRLGCIGCPLARNTQRIAEFKQYPGILKLYIRGGQRWFDDKPDSKACTRFNGNIYDMAYFYLFYEKWDDWVNDKDGGIFPELAIDTKATLEEIFGIDLTIKKPPHITARRQV